MLNFNVDFYVKNSQDLLLKGMLKFWKVINIQKH